MNISNGVFKSVLMNWDSFTFPVMEGTPVSAAGVEANTDDAVGLLPQSVTEKPLIPDCYVLVSGDVSDVPYELSEEAVSAMYKIRFLDLPAGGGGGLPPIAQENVPVLEKQTLEFEDWGGGTSYGSSVANMPAPVVGERYIVTYDGVEYDCVAFHPSAPDPDEVLIGNENIWQGNPIGAGEPFVIDYYHDESASGWDIMTYSTSATHEVGVSRPTQVPAEGAVPIVENEEWIYKPLSLSELGLEFRIPITFADSTWTCELTSAEIKDAYDAGKRLILQTGSKELHLTSIEIDNDSPSELMWVTLHFSGGMWLDCYMMSLNNIDPTVPPTVQFENVLLS